MNDISIDASAANQQLAELLSRANENQQKIERMQAAELELLQTESLTELLDYLFNEHTMLFQLLSVNLLLIDTEQSIYRLLQESGDSGKYHNHLKLIKDSDTVTQVKNLNRQPQLASYQPDVHEWLLTDPDSQVKSVAVLPLMRHGETIGVATCTSVDIQRFQPDLGTDLLQRLAAIMAISIENAVNYHHLQHLGLTDGLTGVRNRRFFDLRLSEEISGTLRTCKPLAFLFIDIDHFKRINDNHGHQSGDKVLRQVANLIYEQLRADDMLARYGGEEFAVLLRDQTATGAAQIAERIRAVIAGADINCDGKQLTVTVSIGISNLQHAKGTAHDAEKIAYLLTKSADSALYQAKENGRNQIVSAN